MSIVVEGLTKIFGQQKAVNDISFEVKAGEIVGFLGPNGAGKSTTMKMLTGYIDPSQGNASVNGYDVIKNTNQVKKSIGYLPEHNPLYLDMYVQEYLRFVASIFDLKNKKALVDDMIERTGLTLERKKKIGKLSKGYRQRVGLAQAIIHDPKVLILDEPTSGLDPNQIVEIRELIKDLGKEKTVLLSTHIMQEVQAICDRVVIINKGEIVANESIDNVQSLVSDVITIEVEFEKTIDLKELKTWEQVIQVVSTEENRYLIEAKKDIRAMVSKFAVEKGVTVLTINKKEQTLESIFQKVTK